MSRKREGLESIDKNRDLGRGDADQGKIYVDREGGK